jgi:hypothetical protein
VRNRSGGEATPAFVLTPFDSRWHDITTFRPHRAKPGMGRFSREKESSVAAIRAFKATLPPAPDRVTQAG